jgi:hypothetical protein
VGKAVIGLSPRLEGRGRLALLGGGEFSFGETLEIDRCWLEASPRGKVGFLPTASGSADYAKNFARYLEQNFGRDVETIPVYRRRDALRRKNLDRLADCAAVYCGGGIAEELVDILGATPAREALEQRVTDGATVVLIAAAAQAAGAWVRSLRGREAVAAFDWLAGAVIEPNFRPDHDRRLRELLRQPGAGAGVGLPAGSCLLLGPGERIDLSGPVFHLAESEGDLKLLQVGDGPVC